MMPQWPLFLAFQAYFVSETKHSTLVRVSRVSFLKSLVQESRKVFRNVFCKPETDWNFFFAVHVRFATLPLGGRLAEGELCQCLGFADENCNVAITTEILEE